MLYNNLSTIILLCAFAFAYGVPYNGAVLDADPKVIDSSDKIKTCPVGYEEIGKQCARTVYVEPEIICANGANLMPDGTCVQYFAKNSECLLGFLRTDTLCVRTRSAPKEIACSDGYLLRSDQKCVKTTVLPNRHVCPAGSEAKGDMCTVERSEAPLFVCPDGFLLEEDHCTIEETYDCTPVREQDEIAQVADELGFNSDVLPPDVPPLFVDSYQSDVLVVYGEDQIDNMFAHNDASNYPIHGLTNPLTNPNKDSYGVSVANGRANVNNLRNSLLGNSKNPIIHHVPVQGGITSAYAEFAPYRNNEPRSGKERNLLGKENLPAPPINNIATRLGISEVGATGFTSTQILAELTRDYIAASICKRVRVIPAEHICRRGVYDNSLCRYDEQVPEITVPGGVSESVIDPDFVCPVGYSPDNYDQSACIVEDEMFPDYFCPTGSVEEGDRCVFTTSSRTVCSPGFAYEHGRCAQTQFAPPLVQYTVTYACEGKECV